MADPTTTAVETRLESWKAIAAYLDRDERTVRRWERTEGLPVHRHKHLSRSSVYAYASELDAWRHGRRIPVAAARSRISFGVAAATILFAVLTAGGGRFLGPLAAATQAPVGPPSAPIAAPSQRFVENRGTTQRGYVMRDGSMVRYNGALRSFERVDIKSQAVRQLTAAGIDLGQQVVWDLEASPDGTVIAAVLRQLPGPRGPTRAELRLFKAGEAGAGRLLYAWESGAVPFISCWSPDHSRIWVFAASSTGAAQIASVRVADGSYELLKTTTWHVTTQTPSLSRDGRYLVYHDADNQKAEPDTFLIATDGSREARLSNPAVDQNPVFAPDGSGFVFLSNRRGTQDLWFQPVADGRPSGEPRVVFEDIGPAGTIHRFADDGSLYYSFSATSWEVYSASLEGSGMIAPQRIDARPGEMSSGPAFSPDNRHLGYLGDSGRRLVLRERAMGAEREFPTASRLLYPTLAFCPGGRTAIVTGRAEQYRQKAYRLNVERGGVEDVDLIRPANAVCLGDEVVYIQQSLDGSTNMLMRRSMATGVEAVLHESVSPNHLDRSPDGTKIAFIEVGKSEARVLTMPVSGGEAAVAATAPVETFQLRSFIRIRGVMWLPDGKELLVVRGSADKPDEYAFIRVAPGGGPGAEVGRMRVPHFETGYFGLLRFSLSPDGKSVAFQQHSGTVSQFWAIDNLLAFVQSGATHRAPGLRPAR